MLRLDDLLFISLGAEASVRSYVNIADLRLSSPSPSDSFPCVLSSLKMISGNRYRQPQNVYSLLIYDSSNDHVFSQNNTRRHKTVF